MYGKFFASTFTGSMFGAGTDVFALWGYIIANAVEGTVEVNPSYVAAILGATPERVVEALAVLCRPDPASRSGAENGRRLRHEGAYQYFVVNHAHYRAMRNEDDRRAYNREAKRRERAKSTDVSLTVNESQSCQPKQEAEAEALVPPNPLPGAIVAKRLTVEEVFGPAEPASDPTADLIGRIMDLWAKCWAEMRRGAVYKPHPVRDYAVFKELAENYGDNLPLLETMFQAWAAVDLGELPQWARSKSPKCFLKLAPEMDAQLRRPA